ncbi:hypothetical protein R3P38DRAFT_3179061 [Favolaschia claudopus]|uniref:Uncharacterized protein n=1 Tax=Favolaschia claudopus TaxID=2862362 RepID=A0AAW0CV73_9AGAR
MPGILFIAAADNELAADEGLRISCSRARLEHRQAAVFDEERLCVLSLTSPSEFSVTVASKTLDFGEVAQCVSRSVRRLAQFQLHFTNLGRQFSVAFFITALPPISLRYAVGNKFKAAASIGSSWETAASVVGTGSPVDKAAVRPLPAIPRKDRHLICDVELVTCRRTAPQPHRPVIAHLHSTRVRSSSTTSCSTPPSVDMRPCLDLRSQYDDDCELSDA